MSEISSNSGARLPGVRDADDIAMSALVSGYMPDDDLTVSEWADEHRVLTKLSSAEPGKYRTARTPYLKEPMDNLSSSSPVTETIVMKGAQLGFTDAGNNWVGYVMERAPGPMLLVMPSIDVAKRNSTQRIEPLIESCPSLSRLIGPAKSRDSVNNKLQKQFPGGLLVMAGANAPGPLASMSCRYLFIDEPERFPRDVGKEGSPIIIAEQRAKSYGRRKKIFKISTPVFRNGPIFKDYMRGDQRHYRVECPNCHDRHILGFGPVDGWGLTWPEGKPWEAVHKCPVCDFETRDHDKDTLLAGGIWVPTAPGDHKPRSYWISSLYTPFGLGDSWADIAAGWERAQGDELMLKSFWNTTLGLPYDGEAEAPEWKDIMDRAGGYRRGTVPKDASFLMFGADIGKRYAVYEVVAFGRNGETWSVDYGLIDGSPFDVDGPLWEGLREVIMTRYEHESGAMLPISVANVDSGFASHETYTFCRSFIGVKGAPIVQAVKGDAKLKSIVNTPKRVDINLNGKVTKRGATLQSVNGTMITQTFYAWLKKPAPEDGSPYPYGFCHFPDGYEQDFFQQVTADQVVEKEVAGGGVEVQIQKTGPNHYHDCRKYAMAAAIRFGLDKWSDKRWEREVEKHFAAAGAKPPTPPEQNAANHIQTAPSGAVFDSGPTVTVVDKGRGFLRPRIVESDNPYL